LEVTKAAVVTFGKSLDEIEATDLKAASKAIEAIVQR
jgi:hypothetical protein